MRLVDHNHGAINSRCAHPACREAVYKYRKRWAYDASHGIKRTAPNRDAALHIATLAGHGWSIRAIAGESGVSPSTVSRIAREPDSTSRKEILYRILAINPEKVPVKASRQTTEPFVPRTGTTRRLQALMWMGYSHADLKAYGINRSLLGQQGRWVTRTTHDKVAEVYRRLCVKPGPHPRAHREAVKRGYVGPAAWDDIDRDEAPEVEWVLRRDGNNAGDWVPAEEAPWAAEDARRIGGEGSAA